MIENIDLGTTSAKHESKDPLLLLMRRVLSENPGVEKELGIELWVSALDEHDDADALLRQVKGYVANLMWERCAPRRQPDTGARQAAKTKAKEVIVAHIRLWTWHLPTTGKRICDSTFAEVAEAAPIAGDFLTKLAAQGAPGALVKQVFPNEAALKEFWRGAQ